MKKNYRLLLGLFFAAPFISFGQKFDPKTVVPKNLAQYKFGMGLDDFQKKNISATTAGDNASFRVEYLDKNAGNNIKQVIYYFDAENKKPLYEMIIQFNDAQSLDAHCSKKLGHPNDGKQWKWTTREGYTFKAWRFSNTLVLALALPSTEWEKDWDN
ncbi:MAG TPA: hypothetical protein VKB95_11210 [Chitinophagaceae bacterium]|nr:hypothetical protein [Chitinophagaceae bacterium]